MKGNKKILAADIIGELKTNYSDEKRSREIIDKLENIDQNSCEAEQLYQDVFCIINGSHEKVKNMQITMRLAIANQLLFCFEMKKPKEKQAIEEKIKDDTPRQETANPLGVVEYQKIIDRIKSRGMELLTLSKDLMSLNGSTMLDNGILANGKIKKRKRITAKNRIDYLERLIHAVDNQKAYNILGGLISDVLRKKIEIKISDNEDLKQKRKKFDILIERMNFLRDQYNLENNKFHNYDYERITKLMTIYGNYSLAVNPTGKKTEQTKEGFFQKIVKIVSL